MKLGFTKIFIESDENSPNIGKIAPIQELEEDKTMTTYEINHNNNMMKTFLSKQSDNMSNWTLHKEGKPAEMDDIPQEFTRSINPNNFRIDHECLERVNILKNVGARNIFKVLTANFVKSLKNKEEFV